MPITKYESEKQPTLEELQKFVGGDIQVVIAPNGDQIVMDEEAKSKRKNVIRKLQHIGLEIIEITTGTILSLGM